MTAIPGAPALRLLRGGADVRVGSAPQRAAAPRADAGAALRQDGARLRFLAFCLCGFGLAMVLGSSSVDSIVQYGSPWSLFERQLLWTVLGAGVFAVAARTTSAQLRRLVRPLLVVTTLLLVAVLVPGLGKAAGGSSRWLGFGPITLQPSEVAKVVFALFLADLVARREDRPDQLRELVRPAGVVLVFLAILILKQPDMGTAVVLVCMTLGVLFAAGVHRRILVGAVGAVLLAGGVIALAAPYRRARLFSFLNPFGHASTTGYQVVQSLIALGSGHVTGAGVGSSAAIWGWLPNAQTDFVFAVVGNQLGLLGAIGVVLAFAAFGRLGFRIAAGAPDRFTSLLATALTCWVVCQAMINVGGVIGALPETGIPLPFVSSGGSSLVVVLAACGILVSVARQGAAVAVRGGQPSVAGAPATRPRARPAPGAPSRARAPRPAAPRPPAARSGAARAAAAGHPSVPSRPAGRPRRGASGVSASGGRR